MQINELEQQWGNWLFDSQFWLRFELGGEDFGVVELPVPRFLRALDRARAVADALFPAPFKIVGLTGVPQSQGKQTDLSRELAKIGFDGGVPLHTWVGPDPRVEDRDWAWAAFDLTNLPHMRDALLWNQIACDMRVQPHANTMSYLVDLERELVLLAYDDRGMDVLGRDAHWLNPVYKKFNAWLLDFDRPRMEAVFGHFARPT